MEHNKKIFSLEENFMKDKKIYDTIWAYFQLNSYKDKDGNTFVYKTKDFTPTNILRNIQTVVGYKPNGKEIYNISLSTVKNNINLYKRMGLMWEGKTTDLYGKEVDVIFLKNEFEYYQLVEYETLRFLMNSTNGVVIKIYVYLLNKYMWKQETKEQYIFTKKELGENIGYSNQNNTNKMIDDCLLNLKNNGLIDWVEFTELNKDGKPMKLHKLTFVGTRVKGMEKVEQKPMEMAQPQPKNDMNVVGNFIF